MMPRRIADLRDDVVDAADRQAVDLMGHAAGPGDEVDGAAGACRELPGHVGQAADVEGAGDVGLAVLGVDPNG